MSDEKDKIQDPSEKEYNEKIIEAFVKPGIETTENIISPLSKEAIKKQTQDLQTLPEEFNLKYIGDLTYLQEIFSSKYDKFHSLDYLQKTRQSMLDDGYTDNSTLNEFLFWATMSRKLQIIYQRMHAKVNLKKGSDEEDAENTTLLKEMRAISQQVASLQGALDSTLDKRKKIKDVVDLHEETMKAAEEFIKSHMGEFTFRCSKCSTIVDTQGLPHFAIKTELDEGGEIVYHIFSHELWYLFRKQLLPLHYLAFILRTSPEGILVTAEMRKEYGAKVLREDMPTLEIEEEKLKILTKEYNDYLEGR